MKRTVSKDLNYSILSTFSFEVRFEKKQHVVLIYYDNKQFCLTGYPEQFLALLLNSQIKKICSNAIFTNILVKKLWGITIHNISSLELLSFFARTYSNNHSREAIFQDCFKKSIFRRDTIFFSNSFFDNEFKFIEHYEFMDAFLRKICTNENRLFLIEKADSIIHLLSNNVKNLKVLVNIEELRKCIGYLN